MPRFAANLTMMFTELPFVARFEAAAKAGFTAVECLFPYDWPAEAIRTLLDDNGLTLALFNLAPGNFAEGERGLATLADRRDEFHWSVEIALIYARATGCKRMHVMAGNSDSSDPEARHTYIRRLRWAADQVADDGITILIEPINRRDMPHYYLHDFNTALEIIAATNRPNIRLQFDIYHRQILHGDVSKALEAMLPMIGHIQVASVPERHEPMSGELNDFHLFSLLDRLGYNGYVGCEYRPAAGTLDGLAWFRDWNASQPG